MIYRIVYAEKGDATADPMSVVVDADTEELARRLGFHKAQKRLRYPLVVDVRAVQDEHV